MCDTGFASGQSIRVTAVVVKAAREQAGQIKMPYTHCHILVKPHLEGPNTVRKRKALDCFPSERILVLLVAGGDLPGRTAWGGLRALSTARAAALLWGSTEGEEGPGLGERQTLNPAGEAWLLSNYMAGSFRLPRIFQ